MKRNSLLAIGLAAAMAFSAGVALAQTADKDSQKFIKAAIEGNYAEIDNGKLAQEKGKSDAVKQYGAMLVKDHSDANEKAMRAAKQLGVTPPTGSAVSAKAGYLKLKMLSGDSFDKAFANDMVKDHQEDIAEFKKATQKNDAAGVFATETLPTLQKHLLAAQSLTQKVQQTTGSK